MDEDAIADFWEHWLAFYDEKPPEETPTEFAMRMIRQDTVQKMFADWEDQSAV